MGLSAYLDIKSIGGISNVKIITDVVKKCGMKGHVTYMSFVASVLSAVLEQDSKARVALLCNTVTSSIVSEATELKKSTDNIFINSGTATEAEVQLCMDADIPMEFWSANSDSHFHSIIPPYITGFASDSYVATDTIINKFLQKQSW